MKGGVIVSERKKNIILFFSAWVSLALGFIAFLFFLDSINILNAILSFVFFAAHSILRRLYGQNLICKGKDYTYIQAMIYYKQCERAKKSAGKKDVDEKILRRIGKLSKYSSEFSKAELSQLYNEGEAACSEFGNGRSKGKRR